MELTPDEIVVVQCGPVVLSATILYTWLVMALLVGAAVAITRSLSSGPNVRRGQSVMEAIIGNMRTQIHEVSYGHADRYLPFIGTLFLFIATSNVLSVVPGFRAPTGSLSTTAALAICVFVAVPLYGIRDVGLAAYLKNYIQPTPWMLPFNVVGELSRTLALAVRLFGNAMSGHMIGAFLLLVIPLVFPVLMQVLGLITGLVQAYIFAVLALVYIASASQAHTTTGSEKSNATGDG